MNQNNKQDQNNKIKNSKVISTKYLVQIAMLGGIATVLLLFNFPLWFAPPFYKIDLSEVPVLIGAFAMGPLAGVLIELVKVLLNLIIDGSDTAGIGELSNFIVGCTWIVPSSMIYKKMKNKKGAFVGLLIGAITMTISACIFNGFVLLPAYAVAFHMPMSGLIEMGSIIIPKVTNLFTFICFIVAPFNILKSLIISLIILLIYKKISGILRIAQ